MADLEKQIDVALLGLRKHKGRYWKTGPARMNKDLAWVLEGARVIVHSKPHDLWLAWHGGTRVRGYNASGMPVVAWEAGTWKRDDVNAQRQVKASIRSRIKTGNFA